MYYNGDMEKKSTKSFTATPNSTELKIRNDVQKNYGFYPIYMSPNSAEAVFVI
jgi:hypothetical protein